MSDPADLDRVQDELEQYGDFCAVSPGDHCTQCGSTDLDDLDTQDDKEFQGYSRCCNEPVCSGPSMGVETWNIGRHLGRIPRPGSPGITNDRWEVTGQVQACCGYQAGQLAAAQAKGLRALDRPIRSI